MDKVLTSGGLIPTTRDTMLDARTRVKTFDDIANIENPAKYLVISVEDTGRKYEVKKLASKVIGGLNVENARIDIKDPEALLDLGLAEEQRAEHEAERTANEEARIEAENKRKTAEEVRERGERGRVASENVRVTAEDIRVENENARIASEKTRQSNETSRSNAESTRQGNEATRINNENTRKTAESERKTAETARENAETSRVNAERNREIEESIRKTNESTRKANETNRANAEQARGAAEEARIQAESTRSTEYSTLKGQMQSTIREGQTAIVNIIGQNQALQYEIIAQNEALQEQILNDYNARSAEMDRTINEGKDAIADTEAATTAANQVVQNYDAKVAEQDDKLADLASKLISKEVVLPRKKTDYLPKTDKSGGVIVSGYKRAEYVVREGDKILVEGKFNVPNDVCAVSFMSTDSASSIVSVVVSGQGEISKILDVPKNAAFLFLADNGAEDGLKAYTTKSKMEEIENIKDAYILVKEQIKDVKGEETLCEVASYQPVRVANTGANCYFVRIEGDVVRNGEPIVCVSESLKNDSIRIADCSADESSNGEDKYPQIICDENGQFSFVPNINDFPLIRIHPLNNTNADAELVVNKNIKGLLGCNKEIQKLGSLRDDVGLCNVVIDSISEEIEVNSTSDYIPKTDNTGGVIVIGYKRWMYKVSEGDTLVISGKYNIPEGLCAVAFARTDSSSSLVAVVSEGIGTEASVSYDVVVPQDAKYLFLSVNDNNFSVKKLKVNVSEKKIDDNRIMLLSKYAQSTLKCYGLMQQSMGDTLSTKIPRFNILCPDDFNDRMNCFKEIVDWAVSDKCLVNSIQCVIAAGDLITALAISKVEFDKKAIELFSYVTNSKIPVLVCIGNHDIGQDGNYSYTEVLTLSELKTMIIDRMYESLDKQFKANCVIPSDADACYYHYDNTDRKVRIIALNDFESPRDTYTDSAGVKHLMYNGTHNEGATHASANTVWNAVYYSKKQLEWLIDTLYSTPADYLVVTNNHVGLKDMGSLDYAGSHSAMIKIINAYKDKTSGSIDVSPVYRRDSNGETEDVLLDGFTISYDFRNAKSNKVVHHNGHHHNFSYYTSLNGSVPCIQTMCSSGVVNAAKFTDGLTETSCDIISVNQSRNDMYVLRYGYYPRETHAGTHLDINGFNYVDEPISII